MPVNLIPIFAIVALLWLATLYFLARWSKAAGVTAFVITVLALLAYPTATNQRKEHDEKMAFTIQKFGDTDVLMLKSPNGQEFTVAEISTIKRFEGRNEGSAQVRWTGWYDFGKLRGYNIQSIEPK
jgi:hypothetical protein